MADDLTHDGYSSWWNGDITTLCGLRFPGGTGWKDRFFAWSVTCPACRAARKARKEKR